MRCIQFFGTFEIEMDLPIPARRPELSLINKRACDLVNFGIPAHHGEKRKWKDNEYLALASELKMLCDVEWY